MDIAKKIVEIASNYGGSVFGEYVMKIIIPVLSGCIIDQSINNVHICLEKLQHKIMLEELEKIFFIEMLTKYHDSDEKVCVIRYNEAKLSLFMFDSVTEILDLKSIMFKIVDDKYIRVDNYASSLYYILNNIVTIDIVPKSQNFFNYINKDYLDKGWIVRLKNDHNLNIRFYLNEFLHENKIKIYKRNGYWYYIPDHLEKTKIAASIILNSIDFDAAKYDKESKFNK